MLFIVLRTGQLTGKEIEYGETDLIVGKGFVVSIRHGASASYAEVRQRCERNPELLRLGERAIMYAILDFVGDNYFPIIAPQQSLTFSFNFTCANCTQLPSFDFLSSGKCVSNTNANCSGASITWVLMCMPHVYPCDVYDDVPCSSRMRQRISMASPKL